MPNHRSQTVNSFSFDLQDEQDHAFKIRPYTDKKATIDVGFVYGKATNEWFSRITPTINGGGNITAADQFIELNNGTFYIMCEVTVNADTGDVSAADIVWQASIKASTATKKYVVIAEVIVADDEEMNITQYLHSDIWALCCIEDTEHTDGHGHDCMCYTSIGHLSADLGGDNDAVNDIVDGIIHDTAGALTNLKDALDALP